MNDRKSWVAVIIAIGFIFAYTQLVLEPYLRPAQEKALQQSKVATAQNSKGAPPPVPGSPSSTSTKGPVADPSGSANANQNTTAAQPLPTMQQLSESGTISLKSDLADITVSLLGGKFLNYQLKNYKQALGAEPLVDLVVVSPNSAAPGTLYIGALNDSLVQYSVEGGSRNFSVNGDQDATIVLTGTLPDGSNIQKLIKVKGNSYLSSITAVVTGPSANQPIWVEWSQYISAESLSVTYNQIGIKYLTDTDKVNTSLPGSDPIGASPLFASQWVSVEDRYFLVSLLPTVGGQNAQTVHEALTNGGHILYARIMGSAGKAEFGIYGGPKDSRVLESVGNQLHRNIDLGIFSFLAFPLLWALRFFDSITNNYGLAIILLTLAVKTIFLPLNKASFKSMKAMQELQPEMKALRERITDPTVLNQEMMALYRKRGVNPMGGCLPILIQIPVFLGLYNALLNAIELRHAPFALWINDLSAPEGCPIFGFQIQLMVILLGVTMFIQQYMTPTPGMDPAQRKIMMFMPLIFAGSMLIYPLPAGLVLYWNVNNTISIVQQVHLKHERTIRPLPATLLAGAGMLLLGYLLTLI